MWVHICRIIVNDRNDSTKPRPNYCVFAFIVDFNLKGFILFYYPIVFDDYSDLLMGLV